MKSVEALKNPKPDMALFHTTTHSPSYASLTNNFDNVHQLKDYCIPVNSYFPTENIMKELYHKMPFALKYYPSGNTQIAELVCAFADIANPDCVLVGNGSTELISWLNSIFIKDDVLIPVPSFGRWTDEPKALGRNVHFLPYSEENNYHLTAQQFVDEVKKSGVKNAVLCNPNNPTGSIMQREEVIWIMKELAYLDNLIIDESFIDFSQAEPPTVKDVVAAFSNSWVLKSLGKNLGLHGLRMGYVISSAHNIKALKKHVPFWNVNGITELLLKLVIAEKVEYENSRLKVIADRNYLKSCFESIEEFSVFPSSANFIYVKLRDSIDGNRLRDNLLLYQACFVRNCGNKIGCNNQYFRIAARPKEEVDFLIAAIKVQLENLKSVPYFQADNVFSIHNIQIKKQAS